MNINRATRQNETWLGGHLTLVPDDLAYKHTKRLAPDCSRIEISGLPKERDEMELLHAMGWATANIHLILARVLA